jgi:LPXTG-site transpeptidase (sortase) family protein
VTGLQHLRAAVARRQAREAWARAPQLRPLEEAALASTASPTAARAKRWRLGTPVARVAIPLIDLDEVVVEGVGARELAAGPGHLPGSVLPGEAGNAIISAHRDRHFHRLNELEIGDTVVTETDRGTMTWRIVRRRVVEKEDRILFNTATATLTLTTCWPVRYLGPAPDRLILTAEPLHPNELAVAGLSQPPVDGW